MFHGVSSRKLKDIAAENQPRSSAAEFEDIMAWLAARFAFLTPEQYLEGWMPGVLLTFDDGLANNCRNVLPVLQKHEAPGLFFVSTQHVADPRDWLGFVRLQSERAWGGPQGVPEDVAQDWYDGMSREALRALAAEPLVTIGSHGVTHAILPECGDRDLDYELRDSKRFLEEIIGSPVNYVAYPRGDYDRRVIERTRTAGYTAGFTIDARNLGCARFELPRVGIYQAGAPYLSLKLSGLHRRPLALRRASV